jgi:hypothetical protein
MDRLPGEAVPLSLFVKPIGKLHAGKNGHRKRQRARHGKGLERKRSSQMEIPWDDVEPVLAILAAIWVPLSVALVVVATRRHR